MIHVLEPGFLTSVQDEGRTGYYSPGIGPSGAMDLLSYRLANALVGNAPGAAALEYTFTGPKLRLDRDVALAMTGGDADVFVNGTAVPQWERIDGRAGDVIHFGFLRSGVRGYIAIAGGIDVPLVMGSRSTHVLCGLGGFEGRKLAAGDQLENGEVRRLPKAHRLPDAVVPRFSRDLELRYVPGLFEYRLTDQGRRAFAETTWTITPDADRTGIRMSRPDTEPLEFAPRERSFGAGQDPSNVVDAGYPIGSIQIPSGIEPIVLARDVVTAGGYFTVGAVVSADMDLLGQAVTRSRVRFVPISFDRAMDLRRQRAAAMGEAIASLD